jgi:hypothetical protein
MMKVVAGLLGGLILAVLGAILVTITFAASKGGSPWGAISFPIFWFIGIVVAICAKTAAKAWRRLLISSAVLSFMLPISGIIYTGSFMATHVNSSSAYAGAAIGGGLISGLMGFVGFFLGVIFLIIGLLVGRHERIVYVQGPTATGESR